MHLPDHCTILTLATPAIAQEKAAKSATLEQMAEAAHTPAEHVKVSKRISRPRGIV